MSSKARAEFDNKTKIAALERAGWRCEGLLVDGTRCESRGPFDFDHDQTDREFGLNTLDNCRVLCRGECHKAKTKADRIRRDIDIARAKRRDGRKKPGKIKGQGFNRRVRRKMDGTIEPR